MEHLIASCIWIDYLRPSTPASVRQVADEAVNRIAAVSCEPIWCELLRHCPKAQRRGIEARLATLPLLPTPRELWRDATALGQRCQDAGVNAGFQDLLIAAICLHHSAVLVTFDRHFASMGEVVGLKTELLVRPE